MKKLISLCVLLTVMALQGTTAALAQEPGHRIVTKTRLQVLFGDLENQWLKAVQKEDTATLHNLLSDEFEIWTPTPPGDPIPREDWQKAAFARKPLSFRISQLSVRGVTLDVSVANFRLSQTFGPADNPQTEDFFVVDVWQKSGKADDWRCTDRYIWRVDTAPSSGNKQDVKPTGKD